jgi:hypothetical protein
MNECENIDGYRTPLAFCEMWALFIWITKATKKSIRYDEEKNEGNFTVDYYMTVH